MSVLRFNEFIEKDLSEAKKAEDGMEDKPVEKEAEDKGDKKDVKVSDKKIHVTLNIQLASARVNRMQELFPKLKLSGVGLEQDEASLKCDDDDLLDTLKILKKECKVKEIIVNL